MMATQRAAVICTTLLVLALSAGVLSESENHPQIVDSVRVQIVSKQDDDGKWVNEVKLEHGTEQAPWKVEVEQKTIDRGGRQSVELTAILTGPKMSTLQAVGTRALSDGSVQYPIPGALDIPGSFAVPDESVQLDSKTPKEFQEVHSSWRGSYYILHTNQMDWVTANKTCADAGAHLAIINSEEEAAFFTGMLNRYPGAYLGAFVGITDEGQEGNWVTLDGESIASAGYALWFREDQPDNANGNENCGAYFPTYRGLNDVPCTGYLSLSICEKDDETSTVDESDSLELADIVQMNLDYMMNSDLPTLDYDMLLSEELEQEPVEISSGYMQVPGFSSLYKFHTEQVDWETANATCVEEGAHLAVINSEEEAKMLAILLQRFHDAYRGAFVGITDEVEEGNWLTIFGETIVEAGFARWFRNDQPDNANGNENCGAILPINGGFNDVPCTKYLMHSICEKDAEPERTTLRSLEGDSFLEVTTPNPEDIEPKTEQPTIHELEYIFASNEMTTVPSAVLVKNDLTALGYEQFSDSKYYKLHADVIKTWDEAKEACQKEGGSMAYVSSDKEFAFLLGMMARAQLGEFDWTFVDFGGKIALQSFPNEIKYSAPGTYTDICSSMNGIESEIVIARCSNRLPFICEISQDRDEQPDESAVGDEQSIEFDNNVHLPLTNGDETRGLLAIFKYISLQRDVEMTTTPPRAESDYYNMDDEEDLLWSETESGNNAFEYIDGDEWF